MAMSPRIVSLIPAGTDIVAALGLGEHLVGVSHECDHPAAAGLPILTASRLPRLGTREAPAVSPRTVDAQVRASVDANDPLYRVDTENLAECRPDIVVTQSVCEVCAVGADQVEQPDGSVLVNLTATTIEGLYADLERVAEAAGCAERAVTLIDAVRTELRDLSAAAADRPRPVTLALEWGDPPYLGGHWVPELIAAAGGHDPLGSAGVAARRAGWAELAAVDAERLVFMPCGYDLLAAVAEGEAMRSSEDPDQARALAAGGYWATDARRLYSRCTPEAVTAGAQTLARILHPEVFGVPDPLVARAITPPV